MPTPRLVISLSLAVSAAIACGASTADGSSSRVPQVVGQVQPLDPLTPEEKAAAEKLVRADPRARDLLGGSAKVVSIEPLVMKATGADDAVRHADLIFARPDTEFGARAIVRLTGTPAIVEFTRVDRRSIPSTEDDVQAAWKIALADPAYTRRLARDVSGLKPEALRIYTEDRKDPCYSGRCFYLIVRDGDYYVSGASVTVDLATKRILPERSPK